MLKTNPESSHRLTKANDIKNYIYGGRALVTLSNPNTRVHHTYLFQKPRDEAQFPPDVRFVYALHDNQKLFYVGMVEQGRFKLTRASRFINDTPIVRGARYIMRMANEPNLNTCMELYHEGICSVCGRKLTSPKSIESGIGPRCRRRLDGLF